MQRHHVQSSALNSAGYDPYTKVLELEFHSNGGVWQYSGFSRAAFKKFINAESLGNFFVTRIKGRYPERRVG